MVHPGRGRLMKVGRASASNSRKIIWIDIMGQRSFIFVEDLLALIRGSLSFAHIMEFECVEVQSGA